MKNQRIERLIKGAKAYARGFANRYSYDPVHKFSYDYVFEKDRPTSWVDFSFKMGSQIIGVTFIHPRYAFSEEIRSETFRRYHELRPRISDILSDSTPNYRKVGASRKKIVSWSMDTTSWGFDRDVYSDIEGEVANTIDVTIKPWMHVRQTRWSRYVTICAPIEIQGPDNLVSLMSFIENLLRGIHRIDEVYKDYSYTREDFLKEVLAL